MNTQNTTNDIKVPNHDLDVLKQHFPQCFDKNGKFDIAKFQHQLTTQPIELTTEKESYGIDWLGKSYARLIASDAATTLLKPNTTHNTLPTHQHAQNLLIKGDNLEVLKHLANAYHEKIKMIYIDPPYNTGSDGFVYEDDRKFTVRELQQMTGVDAEKAKRILEFTKSNSNSHSAWLTFMYPRLYIARQLLKEDGVIFVSIDDNEVAQLRLLLDEIFGEENFVGQIVWQTATDNNPTQIATEHEYVLVFAKNLTSQEYWEMPSEKGKFIQAKYEELKKIHENDIEKTQYELRKWIRKQTNGDDLSGIAHYSYIDEKGVYYPGNSANTKPGGYTYDIIHPITKKVCAKPEYGYRFTFETFKEALANGDVQWGENESTIPKIKKRLDTVMQKLKSYYYEDNRATTAELKTLLGAKVFNNPKSINFIKHIAKFILSANDLILDFFAGSGTTGDAVMQLNAEDGGDRRFILVQIPEPIDEKKNKTAYDFVQSLAPPTPEGREFVPTIFEITKERLLRAAQKINTGLDEKIASYKQKIAELEKQIQTDEIIEELNSINLTIKTIEQQKTQNSFKIFETMPIWEDYDYDATQLDPQAQLFDETKLSAEDLTALLTTWKTYDGIALTQELEVVALDSYKGYSHADKLYLMDNGFSTETLQALLEKIDTDKDFDPKTIVAFGYHFESKNLRELAESLKNYKNKKGSEHNLNFMIRY